MLNMVAWICSTIIIGWVVYLIDDMVKFYLTKRYNSVAAVTNVQMIQRLKDETQEDLDMVLRTLESYNYDYNKAKAQINLVHEDALNRLIAQTKESKSACIDALKESKYNFSDAYYKLMLKPELA